MSLTCTCEALTWAWSSVVDAWRKNNNDASL